MPCQFGFDLAAVIRREAVADLIKALSRAMPEQDARVPTMRQVRLSPEQTSAGHTPRSEKCQTLDLTGAYHAYRTTPLPA